MARISISDAWDETWAFCRAEAQLLLPVGLATFGAASLVMALGMPRTLDARTPVGPWVLWMIPALVLVLIGHLAISAMVLRPGITVREALLLALRRSGAAALAWLAVGAIAAAGMLAIIVLLSIGGLMLRMDQLQVGRIAVAVLVIPACWLVARMLLLMPLIVDRAGGIGTQLKTAFALTRGVVARIAAALILYAIVYLLVTSATEFGGGTLFLAIGRATGQIELATLLTILCTTAVGAVLATAMIVFAAVLYRRLSPASSGT